MTLNEGSKIGDIMKSHGWEKTDSGFSHPTKGRILYGASGPREPSSS